MKADTRLIKMLFSGIDQIGVVVKDISKAVIYYGAMGIGPFKPFDRPVKVVDFKVRGKTLDPAGIQSLIMVTQVGSIELELIQPVTEPSAIDVYFKKHSEGMNHIGLFVKNLDEEISIMEARGFKIHNISRFQNGGGCAFFDTSMTGIPFLELIQWD